MWPPGILIHRKTKNIPIFVGVSGGGGGLVLPHLILDGLTGDG